jgi:hypothetical protein
MLARTLRHTIRAMAMTMTRSHTKLPASQTCKKPGNHFFRIMYAHIETYRGEDGDHVSTVRVMNFFNYLVKLESGISVVNRGRIVSPSTYLIAEANGSCSLHDSDLPK